MTRGRIEARLKLLAARLLRRPLAAFEPLAAWPPEDGGWSAAAVTARFERGLQGQPFLEGVRNDTNVMNSAVVRDLLDLVDAVGLPNARVLDLGCGNALYKHVLGTHQATAGWQYAGADVSADLIALCRRTWPDTNFQTASLDARLPFENAAFDVVLVSGAIQCARDPIATLRELHRVARSAVVLARVPVRKYARTAIFRQRVWHRDGNESHVIRVFNRHELEADFGRTGFRIRHGDRGTECYRLPDAAEPAVHHGWVLETMSVTRDSGTL